MQLIPDSLRPEAALHVARVRDNIPAGCDAILIGFNANIYYTSLRFFRGYVYIPVEGEAVRFVIRPMGFTEEKDVIYVRKPEEIPSRLRELGMTLPATLGLEQDTMTWSDIARLVKAMESPRVINASPLLRAARMVKTPWEIGQIKEDGIHHAEAYRRFTKAYREDMTDIEWQVEMERILRLEGCLGYSRVSGQLMEINLGSVISGDNADAPTPYDFAMGGAGVSPAFPVGADGTTMRPGTTVMVDMNGAFNGYQTDMTRVWRIGEIAPLALEAHRCSLDILRELERIGVPGCPVAELYNKAISLVEERGLTDNFMGHRQHAPFIGHGVGIELNEMPVLTPRSKDVLAENMVIAIEPKFVIPGTGAVGAENTYQVTPDGLVTLTRFPEDIIPL
ncbi:MAG: Xaa-Pro peptidase family protein [Muribaculaceae bacterium]|nr:Xaa-Pro peptidase family protein [Muribaculaceae bacterium]